MIEKNSKDSGLPIKVKPKPRTKTRTKMELGPKRHKKEEGTKKARPQTKRYQKEKVLGPRRIRTKKELGPKT